MKPFKTYISELFDKPLPYKITSNQRDWKKYEFSISRTKTHPSLGAYRSSMLVKVAIIDYDGDSKYEVDFKVDNSHDLTGTVGSKDSLKIFTTVVAIILDFIKAVQPNEIEFSGVKTKSTGESRVKLYDRMAKRLTPKGYEYSSEIRPSETIYTFRKKEVK